MKLLTENVKEILSPLSPILPYGVLESWDDLNPRLYLGVHIFWLKFYGVWFSSSSPTHLLYWVQVLYTIIVICVGMLLPGLGEVMYLVKRGDNVATVAEGTYLFLTEMYAYFKLFILWLNKDKVLRLLEHMYCEEFKPKEEEHKEIIIKSIKTARFVMTYYTSLCTGAVVVGLIWPIAENFEILPTNVEYPYIDKYETPYYEILYIHQIYYKNCTCIIDGVLDTMLAAFAICAIGQMEILMFNLRNFDLLAERRRKRAVDENKPSGSYSKDYHIRAVLRDCIVHHNSIIRYIAMIEEAFSFASAIQFMLSAMVLCLVGVQCLAIENPASHPMQIMWTWYFLVCMCIEVFIMCYYGNELIWKSFELRDAAYEGPWVGINPEAMKYIIIFRERCDRPLQVTAGKIFILSLDNYSKLINWAYKAFAVMNNMKK